MIRGILTAVFSLSVCLTAWAEVGYNRDVLPILASKCFACHGADAAKRKAKLRLDAQEVAYAGRDGVRAVVPGKLEEGLHGP